MKKAIFSLSLYVFLIVGVTAQVPQTFNYQATLRDNSGQLLVMKTVSLRISIVQGSSGGTTVYSEVHSATTTSLGIMNLQIGTGTSTDIFSSIDWNNGPYFLKVELDPDGGTHYTALGTNAMASVPYALQAKNAGTVDWQNIQNKPDLVTAAEYPLNITGNVMSLPVASSISSGYLSSNDWNLFNSRTSSLWLPYENNIYYNMGRVGIGTTMPQHSLSIVGNEEEWPGRIFLSIKNSSASPKSLAYLKLFAGPGETGTALGHISTTYAANERPQDVAGYGILASSENGMIISATKPDLSPGIIKFFNGQMPGTAFIETMRIGKEGNVSIGKSSMNGIYHPKLLVYNGWLQVADSTDHDAGIVVSHLNKSGYGYARTVHQVYEGVNGDPYTEFRIRNTADDNSITSWSIGADNSDEDKLKINVYTNYPTGSSPSYGNNFFTLTTDGKVGIGTISPAAKLEIADGDVYIKDIDHGIIMTSPNGQCWRGTINDSGVLEFTAVACP